MGFYDELSRVYSIVFPADEDTVNFLSRGTVKGSLILDAACGTGDFSIELSKLGYNVDGIDLSTDMIKAAKGKADGLNVSFTSGDMTKIKDIYSGKRYDMIFCIGNSIVHMNDKSVIGQFIEDCCSMINENGRLVVQIVNYDRVIKNNVTSLPMIDKSDEGVRLERKYNYRKDVGLVDFITELGIFENGREQKYYNSIPLIPLMHDELIEMLKKAGFKKADVFGSFREKAYIKDESYSLVVRAEK